MHPLRTSAAALDFARARILEWTLQVPLLRDWFTSRHKRLLFQFLFSMSWQLPLAILFPVPVLVLGPAIFGTAHLFATLRHGIGHPKDIFPSQRMLLTLIAAIWVGVGFARWYDGFAHLTIFEIAGMALTLLIALPFLRLSAPRATVTFAFIAALGWIGYHWPLHLTAVLVLGHHFVSLMHWRKSARTSQDRRTVVAASAAFVLVHIFIFIAPISPWIGSVPLFGVDFEQMTATFQAWDAGGADLLARSVVAYAFGQSMHYFVWLKCIPDQQHSAEVSTSFRQSLRLLEKDFGPWLLRGAAVASLGMVGLAFFMESESFRTLYFSAAAFHGFLEISTLFFPRQGSA